MSVKQSKGMAPISKTKAIHKIGFDTNAHNAFTMLEEDGDCQAEKQHRNGFKGQPPFAPPTPPPQTTKGQDR